MKINLEITLKCASRTMEYLTDLRWFDLDQVKRTSTNTLSIESDDHAQVAEIAGEMDEDLKDYIPMDEFKFLLGE